MDAICLVCESAFGVEGTLSTQPISTQLQVECPNCQMGILMFDDEEHTAASKSLFKPIPTETIDEEGAAILSAPPTSPDMRLLEDDQETSPAQPPKKNSLPSPAQSPPVQKTTAPPTTSVKINNVIDSFISQPLDISDFDPLVPGSETLHPPEDLTRTLPNLRSINSQLTKALTPDKMAPEPVDTAKVSEKEERPALSRDTLESSPRFDIPVAGVSSTAPQEETHTPSLVKEPTSTLTPLAPPPVAKKTPSKPIDPALEALASQLDSAIAHSFLDDPLFAPSPAKTKAPTTPPPVEKIVAPEPESRPHPIQTLYSPATTPSSSTDDPGEISMVTPLAQSDVLGDEEPLLGEDGMETLTVSDTVPEEKPVPAASMPSTAPPQQVALSFPASLASVEILSEDDIVVPPEPAALPTPPPMNAVPIAPSTRASSDNVEVPRFVMAPPSAESSLPATPKTPSVPDLKLVREKTLPPPPPPQPGAKTTSSDQHSKPSQAAATPVPVPIGPVAAATPPTDDDDLDLDLALPTVASKDNLRAISSSSMEIAQEVPMGPAPAPHSHLAVADASPGATLPLFSTKDVQQYIADQTKKTPPPPPKTEDTKKTTQELVVPQDKTTSQEKPVLETKAASVSPVPSLAEPGEETPAIRGEEKAAKVPPSPGMIDFDQFSQEFFEAPAKDPEAEHEEELMALLKLQQEESRRIVRRILLFAPLIIVSAVLMFWAIHYTYTNTGKTTPAPDTSLPAVPRPTLPRTPTTLAAIPARRTDAGTTTPPTRVPDTRRDTPTPDTRKDKPEDRRDTPEVRKDGPDTRKDEPGTRRDAPAPDVRKDEPDTRRDAPAPEVRKDEPDTRKDEPEVRPTPVARRKASEDDEDENKDATAKKQDDDEDETPKPQPRVVKRRPAPRRVVKRRPAPRRKIQRVALAKPRPRPRARKASVDPAVAQKHYMAGIQAFGAGHLKQAETKLKQAIQANPNHADSHRILGMTYMRMQQNAKAKQHLNTFLRLAPNHPIAGMIRGVVGQLK